MAIGMSKKIEKYNPDRVELIKLNLQQSAEIGRPRDYEIQVDGMKAVWRTNDVGQFDNHELYLDDNCEELRILLFQGTSPKYDTFVFKFGDYSPQSSQELSGITLTVSEQIEQALRLKELEQARLEIEELKQSLMEAEEYQEQLEDRIQELESQKPDKSERVINTLLTLGESAIKNNPGLLRNIPIVGETLSGGAESLIAKENQALRMELETMKNLLTQLGLIQEQSDGSEQPQFNFKEVKKEEQ